MTEAPSPATVALVRRRYLAGAAVKDIVAEAGITRVMLDRCLKGEFADGSGAVPVPIARRHARARRPTGSRAALVARMWRTAERQVEEIEDRLKATGLELAERESNARTLAVVARTLRELAVVDEARQARGKGAAKDRDDDAVPRNIDELRRALAKKLDEFVAGRSASVRDDAG